MMESSPRFLDQKVANVCFIGAGFVGGPTAAVLATHCPEIEVVVVDVNASRNQQWKSDALPIFEPGLLELLRECRVRKSVTDGTEVQCARRRNLCFTHDVETGIRGADMIFLCVDTAPQCDETGEETTLDLTNLKRAVLKVGETAVKDFVIVEKSTVPCGTARLLQTMLSKTVRPSISYQILSNPEFLAEGSAVRDLQNPDRVLIGCSDSRHGRHAAQLLSGLYEHWVPSDKIIAMDTWSSELSKLCANALLAQRISSINSFSMMCEKVGADVSKIAEAVKADHRIGPHMLNPSVGFGGSCFQKDISHLVYLAKSLGLEDVAQYWKAVLAINQAQKLSFADRISQQLASLPVKNTKIGILGFTFKAETNDVRNSPAIDVVKHLIERYYDVRIYDPGASESSILEALGLGDSSKARMDSCVQISASPYQACESASAVVILTEWKEFEHRSDVSDEVGLVGEAEQLKDASDYDSDRLSSVIDSALGSPSCQSTSQNTHLDWSQVALAMVEPRHLFDGRNIVDDTIAKFGFRVHRIGKHQQR